MPEAWAWGILWAALGCAFVVAAALYILAPGRADIAMLAQFYGRHIAHRGLHTPDQGVPENSLPAFKAAVELGFGVELDVHITKDDKLVVFHDDTLLRACGVEGRVEDMTWEELNTLSLFGSEHRIPLLSEVLELISGREPVVVELKRVPRNRELCEKTYGLLKKYRGVFCIESFDPRIVRWFRKNAPAVMRGQLAARPAELKNGAGRLNAFLVGNLLTNFLSRPHFIAYKIGRWPLTLRMCRFLGAFVFTWTSRDYGNEKASDVIIFEHYLPRVKFK